MKCLVRGILHQLAGNLLRINCGLLWATAWEIIKMLPNNQRFCYGTFHPLGKEFQKQNFSLSHDSVDDFLKSQWQSSEKCYPWLLYRWGLAVCFCIGVFGSLVQQWNQGRWFIYLTDWGFSLCMFVSVFGAALVTVHHFKAHNFGVNSCAIKFYWLSHWSTLVIATLVTFVYWIFIYPTVNDSALDLYNLWAHGFNTILMLLDHLLIAFPTRILHFIYPLILASVYGVFTIIYYFSGGVDIYGNHYIYAILDWSKPGWAILAIFGCLLVLLVSTVLLFCLYKLRQQVYTRYFTSKLIISNA